MKVLVIAPHQDDEVMGCGGTIRKMVNTGVEVMVLSLCQKVFDHAPKLVDEYRVMCRRACRALGVTRVKFLPFETEILGESFREVMAEIAETVKEWRPEMMFFPFDHDLHQDHRTASEACGLALRGIQKSPVKTALMYEVGGSTGQRFGHPFVPNWYVPIGWKDLRVKVTAMLCYGTELRVGSFRSREGIETMAAMRGMEAGTRWAEAFHLYRRIG